MLSPFSQQQQPLRHHLIANASPLQEKLHIASMPQIEHENPWFERQAGLIGLQASVTQGRLEDKPDARALVNIAVADPTQAATVPIKIHLADQHPAISEHLLHMRHMP